MLYRNNYFTKEFRQKYVSAKMSFCYLILFGIFLGLLTFSLHFLLQTVTESVLSSKFPQFMSQSYHTVLYTYLHVCNFFFLVYFLINYKYITFYEIHCNRWYLLKKLGYHSLGMILSKLSVMILSVMFIYTTGFMTSILLTVFLKYTFITKYFVTMYLVGCVNVFFIAVMVALGSLRFVEKETPKYDIITVGLLLYILQLTTNYFPVVKNRVRMQDVKSLFQWQLTPYVLISIGILAVAFVLIVVIALLTATKYHHSASKYRRRFQWHRSLDMILYSCLALFIIFCSAIQIMILSVSFASPEREIAIRGLIPYVFQSTTMEPTIHKNDLAYFQKIDVQAPLSVGDIVLFKEDTQIFVERIISIENDYITVDIDKYPKDSKEGIMLKSIDRKSIYAKYSSCNRYLGALILFANTTIGRLIFLVLPSILLFFHQPIMKRIRSVLLIDQYGGDNL